MSTLPAAAVAQEMIVPPQSRTSPALPVTVGVVSMKIVDPIAAVRSSPTSVPLDPVVEEPMVMLLLPAAARAQSTSSDQSTTSDTTTKKSKKSKSTADTTTSK